MAIGHTRQGLDTSNSSTIDSGITLNNTTSTTIVSANADRTFFRIENPNVFDIWVKLQTAATDDDKKGIFVARGDSWTMPDNIYTGAISAIAELDSPVVYSTEY